ncbi:MAG: hypothetical protein OXC11_11615 [Rhodospirillales bacterium]|nr:hypothetical protein [Rhodospirillales bacterium]
MIDFVKGYLVPLLPGAVGFVIWFRRYRRRIRWRQVGGERQTRGGKRYEGTCKGRTFSIKYGKETDSSTPWYLLEEGDQIIGRGSISELMEIAERVSRVKRGGWTARSISETLDRAASDDD